MRVAANTPRRQYPPATGLFTHNMRPHTKLYEHPDLKADEADITLLSTICFVLVMAITGALVVLSVSCLIFWDDCKSTYAFYGSRPHFLSVQQAILRG